MTKPVTKEKLSFEKYLSLSVKDTTKIKSIKIIPPKLGGQDFGYVLVQYKFTQYKNTTNGL